jgi:hypothetical protein
MDRPAQTVTPVKSILVVLVPAALLGACSSGKETGREAPPLETRDILARYEADFRPSDHDTLASPRPLRTSPSPEQGREESANTPPAEGEGELVPGFRVQIYSTTDIDAAKAKKQEAESDFPTEWFYLQYDPPTYKIRGGNFLQRYEAERFVKLAVEKGFTDSWAVPEKVLRQPPPPPH